MARTKRRLPPTEEIGGHEFQFVFSDTDADGKPWGDTPSAKSYAETDGFAKVIRFNPAQTDAQLHETRVHETIHAILHTSGLTELLDEKLEEAIAVALEHGLSPIISFNRK